MIYLILLLRLCLSLLIYVNQFNPVIILLLMIVHDSMRRIENMDWKKFSQVDPLLEKISTSAIAGSGKIPAYEVR